MAGLVLRETEQPKEESKVPKNKGRSRVCTDGIEDRGAGKISGEKRLREEWTQSFDQLKKSGGGRFWTGL